MMEIYTVQQGDTLWRIANRLDADLAQLFLANGLTASSPLVPGQALAVPDRFFQYIVQEGDQLGTIAARLGVLAQALINANQLRNPASLFPGQVLFIPYRNHTVKQGETLYGIARTYGADMGAIMQANRLPGTALSAGQVLRIPAPRRPVKEVNAYTTGFGAAGTAEVYQLGPYFTYLSPFRHTFREDGSLTPLNDRSVLQAAEANGVLPLLILANFTSEGFSSDLAARLLRNEALQETLISNLLATIGKKGTGASILILNMCIRKTATVIRRFSGASPAGSARKACSSRLRLRRKFPARSRACFTKPTITAHTGPSLILSF